MLEAGRNQNQMHSPHFLRNGSQIMETPVLWNDLLTNPFFRPLRCFPKNTANRDKL
jgi:hypothetical protein